MPNSDSSRALDRNCGTRIAIELISPKWRPLFMCALSDGEHRYNGPVRKIEGISQKMLTETLRAMERDGLVERHSDGSVPKKVEYSLTRLGKTLQARLGPFCRWAEANRDKLVAHRLHQRTPGSESPWLGMSWSSQ